MLQHTSGRLLLSPLFAIGLLLGGGARAQDGEEAGWTLSGIGTIGGDGTLINPTPAFRCGQTAHVASVALDVVY
ncbi:hypothetical protein ACI48D_07405 [Massilia sp. LXY-6]|uniref:hypothetical protein n=1 Tax=Massilia sp. LXY-6 TaxID=3379823 RepID=UPI003EDF784D